jgi:electron transport protein HydN
MAHKPADIPMLTPENFRPRLKVIKGARVSTAVLCRHCDDAPCANACPAGAIVVRDNSVQVLQERCVGCKTCMVACPYGAIEVVTVPADMPSGSVLKTRNLKAQAIKCDLCIDRAGGPACVEACPTKGLHLVDAAVLEATLKARREQAALVDIPNLPL